MSTAEVARPKGRTGFVVLLVVLALVAIPVGLFGTAVTPGWAMLATGALLATAGMVAAVLRQRWGFVMLAIGAGLLLGIGGYVGLGLIQPDGPACGGTGCQV